MIKTTGGQIFGGYNDLGWKDGNGPERKNFKSFVFYFKDGKAIKLTWNGERYSRYEI